MGMSLHSSLPRLFPVQVSLLGVLEIYILHLVRYDEWVQTPEK